VANVGVRSPDRSGDDVVTIRWRASSSVSLRDREGDRGGRHRAGDGPVAERWARGL